VKGNPRVLVLIDEIRAHARAIMLQTKKGREVFFNPEDPAIRDAVAHRLELLAEAAGKLPKGFAEQNPGLAWSELPVIRRLVAHPYDDALPRPVDSERLWRFVTEEVPAFERKLERPRIG